MGRRTTSIHPQRRDLLPPSPDSPHATHVHHERLLVGQELHALRVLVDLIEQLRQDRRLRLERRLIRALPAHHNGRQPENEARQRDPDVRSVIRCHGERRVLRLKADPLEDET
jgi:hypothetical protein